MSRHVSRHVWLGWCSGLAVAGLTSLGAPATAQLSDINTYWAAPYISQLSAQQVLGGFPDGTFRPFESVTRAQFAAIVTKAFGLDTNVPPRQFTDAIPGWAAPAINAAAGAGFVSGFPDGTFRPNDSLTRAQAITVLTRAAGVAPLDPTQSESVLGIYSDNLSIPNFARPSVAAATQAGLIVLYPDPQQINAARTASRGEVAALTYLALAKAGRLPNLAVPPGATIPGVASAPPLETIPTPVPTIEAPQAPPQIRDFLTRSDLRNLQPGSTLDFILLGTPGAQAFLSISGIAQNLPMTETRSGQYEVSYTIRNQDRATAAVVEAQLIANNLVSSVRLSQTLAVGTPQDTSFPTISALSPANGSTAPNRQPMISAQFRDPQGIDLNSFSLLVNDQNVTRQAQLNQQGFSYTPNRPLPVNRPTQVRIQIADTAGNTSFAEWSFSVTPAKDATPRPGRPQSSEASPPASPTASPVFVVPALPAGVQADPTPTAP